MQAVTEDELLEQLLGTVERFCLPPDEQRAWAAEHRVPTEEMALELYDVLFSFLPRLREHHLVDRDDEQALSQLEAAIERAQRRLFGEYADEITDAPEWETIKSFAAEAATLLRRPTAVKLGARNDDQ